MCLCTCVVAAGYGDGKGTHLSIHLCLMKGPHYDKLTWPLRGNFEIKLLNQISDSKHYVMKIPYDHNTPKDYTGRVTGDRSGNGWGFSQYISNDKITLSCQFLKDDCLFFQVTNL